MRHDSDSRKRCSGIVPARTSSDIRQTSVALLRTRPWNVPVSIGPPGSTTAGRSTDAAAISSDGIVLSQPPRRTRPSTGLARNISSAAIAAMFRHSIAVGRTCVSPSDTTGRLSGTPPASQTPFATDRDSSSRCELHGVRSEAVFAIAICGRPSNAESGVPRRIHARWMYALRSRPAYQSELRSGSFTSLGCSRGHPSGTPARNGPAVHPESDRRCVGRPRADVRAFVIRGPRDAGVEDVPEPVAATGEVVVDVRRVGICGTDVELYTGGMAYFRTGRTRYPVRIGHEWTGVVRQAASDVDPGWVGRRVVGD